MTSEQVQAWADRVRASRRAAWRRAIRSMCPAVESFDGGRWLPAGALRVLREQRPQRVVKRLEQVHGVAVIQRTAALASGEPARLRRWADWPALVRALRRELLEPASRPWTASERGVAASMIAAGASTRQVGAALGRSAVAVRLHLRQTQGCGVERRQYADRQLVGTGALRRKLRISRSTLINWRGMGLPFETIAAGGVNRCGYYLPEVGEWVKARRLIWLRRPAAVRAEIDRWIGGTV